ncbi:hypothetical protein BC835DRAFT_1355444 [Cytidiella melzeri]|nr:hypothetical protein BC835DRAFT_1355444 [Cytidiella melzeri]
MTGENHRASRRSVGSPPAAGPASASLALATRPLISHGRTHSAASTFRSTASSESSHDPPSTPNDTTRISISSTLYQDSHYSIPFDPPYSAPLPTGTSNLIMHSSNSDRESFIDLASPRSPAFRSSDLSINDTKYAYRKDLANLADLSSRPPPPVARATAPAKPPLPTSPKPAFSSRRSHSAQPPRNRPPGLPESIPPLLPSTTNLLDPKERADRLRQNRKLAQMLGQTPGAMEALAAAQVPADVGVPSGLLCAPGPGSGGKRKQQHQRGALSMAVNTTSANRVHLPRAIWPPPEGTKHMTLGGARRHSSPLSPDVASFLDDADRYEDGDGPDPRSTSSVIVIGSPSIDDDFSRPLHRKRTSSLVTSPTSFIDLSEEDVPGDFSSLISLETPTAARRTHVATSPSSASIYSFTSDQLAEEDRRRKREKVAKLHRFLGSRVPSDLVLGQLSIDTTFDLPPPASSTVSAIERHKQMDFDSRKVWVRRRRSSSAAEFGGKWSDDIDRLKEELNDKEKAQNVKRAIKMEKVCLTPSLPIL